MGLSRIFGLFAAVVSVSALAADPPAPRGNVSVNVNPTTGYYSTSNSTLRLPNGVSVSPSTGVAPVVSRYPAGLQQTLPTGITIDAIKKSAPLPAVVRSTTQTVKGAASRCLTSGRCNVGLILAGEGLSRLFDGLDWVMGEGGKIQKGVGSGEGGNLSGLARYDRSDAHEVISTDCPLFSPLGRTFTCSVTFERRGVIYTEPTTIRGDSRQDVNASAGGRNFIFYQYDHTNEGSYEYLDVPSSEIAPAVEANYTPEPSDWPALTPEMQPDDIEITSAPTLEAEPKTVTVYDAEGNPQKVTVTNTWYDFSPKDNPSPKPALDMKTREETKTYEDGVLTGTTTTESTASGGAGGPPAPELDIPTDCEFMPTVCAFLEWYRDDDEPEEPDLSVLIDDRDFTESYTISGGSKQCPPPYELALPFIGQTYYLSFDFACDFASKIYYFIMAAAYIFAAYITIGVARHG